jgi:hypothetical protein
VVILRGKNRGLMILGKKVKNRLSSHITVVIKEDSSRFNIFSRTFLILVSRRRGEIGG